MPKRIIIFLLLAFVFIDIGYTFVQNMQTVLDGDMAECIIPANGYQEIFKDPLGITVITQNASYPNPNRFFVYYIFSKYFKTIPFLLQHFVDPIASVYLASAIAKTIIQVIIILFVGFYITRKRSIFSSQFLIAIALIIPLFQINGYRSYMGIIDPCVTYTFNYALPCMWLLIFYFPFYHSSFYKKKLNLNKFLLIVLIGYTLFISLNGPLNTGVIVIVSLLYLFKQFTNTYSSDASNSGIQRILNSLNKIPRMHFFFFMLAGILSLYSLYIGSKSSLFPGGAIPLIERYRRLPEGIYYLLTGKIGYPLFLIMISINTFLIKKIDKTSEAIKILKLLTSIGIFSLLYILLLPLGGYRTYRPDIIRYDSIMPITIALIGFYGLSSLFLISNLKDKKKKIYLLVILAFSFVYINADQLELGKNTCEKQALTQLSNATEDTVLLKNDCTVMAWEKITNPQQSELNAELLHYWGITKEKKLYYQK